MCVFSVTGQKVKGADGSPVESLCTCRTARGSSAASHTRMTVDPMWLLSLRLFNRFTEISSNQTQVFPTIDVFKSCFYSFPCCIMNMQLYGQRWFCFYCPSHCLSIPQSSPDKDVMKLGMHRYQYGVSYQHQGWVLYLHGKIKNEPIPVVVYVFEIFCWICVCSAVKLATNVSEQVLAN